MKKLLSRFNHKALPLAEHGESNTANERRSRAAVAQALGRGDAALRRIEELLRTITTIPGPGRLVLRPDGTTGVAILFGSVDTAATDGNVVITFPEPFANPPIGFAQTSRETGSGDASSTEVTNVSETAMLVRARRVQGGTVSAVPTGTTLYWFAIGTVEPDDP